MFGSEILEVATGIAFVFLITSLLASTIRETIEALLKTRAIQLERGIRQLLDDPTGSAITKDLFAHPQLFGLFPGAYDTKKLTGLLRLWPRRLFGWLSRSYSGLEASPIAKRLPFRSNLPNYIPSRNIALALIHLVSGSGDQDAAPTFETLKAGAMTLPAGRLRQAMLVAIGESEGDLDRARTSLEAWFDSGMDRVSGWYKRETQWILLAIGFALAISLNIDALAVNRALNTNNNVRQQIVERAEALYPALKKANGTLPDDATVNEINHGLAGAIGWSTRAQRHAKLVRYIESHLADAHSPAAHERWAAELEVATNPSWHRLIAMWWKDFSHGLWGWLATALAVSLGAPFWFDILNKIMVIRSTVKPFEKSPSEGSDDRKGGASPADLLAPKPPGNTNTAVEGASSSSAAGTPSALAVSLRVAIDGIDDIDAESLELHTNDDAIPVPDSGLVEVLIATGVRTLLSVKATKNGVTVSWLQSFFPDLNDDGLPVVVSLTEGAEG